MDTIKAFAMGEANRGREEMVFDWHKAVELIREHKPQVAAAGLSGDWEWTGGTIFENGQIVNDEYTFLASTWATPLLILDGTEYDCFRMSSEVPDWSSDTKWPQSALDLLSK